MHEWVVPLERDLAATDRCRSPRSTPLAEHLQSQRYFARLHPSNFSDKLICKLVPAVVLAEQQPIVIVYAMDDELRVAPLLMACTSPLLRGRGGRGRQLGLIRLCELPAGFIVSAVDGSLLWRGTQQECNEAAAKLPDEQITHAFLVKARGVLGGFELLDARTESGGLACGVQLINDPSGTAAEAAGASCQYYSNGLMEADRDLEGEPALDASWATLEPFELTWDYGKDYHSRHMLRSVALDTTAGGLPRVFSGSAADLYKSVISGEYRVQQWLSARLTEALPPDAEAARASVTTDAIANEIESAAEQGGVEYVWSATAAPDRRLTGLLVFARAEGCVLYLARDRAPEYRGLGARLLDFALSTLAVTDTVDLRCRAENEQLVSWYQRRGGGAPYSCVQASQRDGWCHLTYMTAAAARVGRSPPMANVEDSDNDDRCASSHVRERRSTGGGRGGRRKKTRKRSSGGGDNNGRGERDGNDGGRGEPLLTGNGGRRSGGTAAAAAAAPATERRCEVMRGVAAADDASVVSRDATLEWVTPAMNTLKSKALAMGLPVPAAAANHRASNRYVRTSPLDESYEIVRSHYGKS